MRFSQTGSDVASPNLLDRFAIWAVEHAISAQMATTIATPHPIDVCEGNSLPDFRVLLVLSQTLGLPRPLADYKRGSESARLGCTTQRLAVGLRSDGTTTGVTGTPRYER